MACIPGKAGSSDRWRLTTRSGSGRGRRRSGCSSTRRGPRARARPPRHHVGQLAVALLPLAAPQPTTSQGDPGRRPPTRRQGRRRASSRPARSRSGPRATWTVSMRLCEVRAAARHQHAHAEGCPSRHADRPGHPPTRARQPPARRPPARRPATIAHIPRPMFRRCARPPSSSTPPGPEPRPRVAAPSSQEPASSQPPGPPATPRGRFSRQPAPVMCATARRPAALRERPRSRRTGSVGRAARSRSG